jgi:copper(I)-binding protein
LVLVAIAVVTTTVSCSGDTGFTSSCEEGSCLEISDAWGRPSPTVATTGAFFMTIKNDQADDDALINAVSPACGTVELHESYMNDEGAMAMRPIADSKVEIPAKGSTILEPGGLHLMCIDKIQDFAEGAELELTLQFQNAGHTTLNVEIREP